MHRQSPGDLQLQQLSRSRLQPGCGRLLDPIVSEPDGRGAVVDHHQQAVLQGGQQCCGGGGSVQPGGECQQVEVHVTAEAGQNVQQGDGRSGKCFDPSGDQVEDVALA